MPTSTVRVEPVRDRRGLRDVVMFPFWLYRDLEDPYWVPPLITERMEHLDPEHNPFFEHAEMQLFRATRDGKAVGTIAAIDDEVHPRVWDEPVGFFGLFECIDDAEVATALFGAARQWLSERGREIMRGPMNLNINDECGLLIDGFDGLPVIMMTYNPRYYQTLVESYGFVKAKDLYAYKAIITGEGLKREGLPDRVVRVSRIARERYGVTLRKFAPSRLDEEVELIKPIHREAWRQNWGALPMSDAEYAFLAKSLSRVVDPDLSYLAFIDGEPVGAFLTLPDYNQVAYYLNGRLLPFGWLKYLWYRRKITRIRGLIMGVLAEHRLKGVESLFYEKVWNTARRKGFEWGEMSWILEDNYKVIRGIEGMGGERYRSYRIYDIPTL